jgi:diguanylate cyclase (GGDEF)-like protein/PAS domain S-box-containing protein
VFVLLGTLLVQTLYGRHQRAGQLLRSERARVRQMYDRSPDTILTVDPEHRVLYANPQAEALSEKPASELVGSTCHSGLFDCDEPCGDCPVPRVFATGEVAERTVAEEVGGHHRWLEQIFYPVVDAEGRVSSVVESTRDTTMLRMAQTTIHRMAYYDPLTDLPNRSLFCDRLATALSRARRRNETVAVVFVDLDDFKEINDMRGHGVGDGLLKAVGSRLRDLLREEDTVARQGGDEFTIIARMSSREDAGHLAERILESLGEGFKVDGHQLRVSASIGIATYPEDGESDLDLIRHADAAMYCAKDSGHNVYRLYTPEMS